MRTFPANLRNAVLSAEDKRFLSAFRLRSVGHRARGMGGYPRGQNEQGASTLTMQVARNMFLTLDRTWRRKAAEIMITIAARAEADQGADLRALLQSDRSGLPRQLRDPRVRRSAQAYFGKDLKSLTLPEAATLAGMARGASYYNPYRHADRVRDRRNWILGQMRQNGYIDDREYAVATETPLKVVSGAAESSDAPYFVDLLNEDLDKRFPGYDFQAHADKIYTTLDLNLQRAANEAVAIGMKQVDDHREEAETLQERAVRRAAVRADRAQSAYRTRSRRWWAAEITGSASSTAFWPSGSRVPSSSRSFTRPR